MEKLIESFKNGQFVNKTKKKKKGFALLTFFFLITVNF